MSIVNVIKLSIRVFSAHLMAIISFKKIITSFMLSSENMFANGFIIFDASGVEYNLCVNLDLDILVCLLFLKLIHYKNKKYNCVL